MSDTIFVNASENEGVTGPINIRIEAKDGALTGLTATGPNGQPCEVIFHVKYKKPIVEPPASEGIDGGNDDDPKDDPEDECRCCELGNGGKLVCYTCPCP